MSFANSSTVQSGGSSIGLGISSRNIPDAAVNTVGGPNQAIYDYQQFIKTDIIGSGYPQCELYAPSATVSTSSVTEATQYFSEKMGDAVFDCPDCVVTDPGVDPGQIYYDGTLLVPETVYWSSCYSGNGEACGNYPYALIDYSGSNSSYPYNGNSCPTGFEQLTMRYPASSQQMLSSTYLNLLSNVVSNRDLQNGYGIQAGFTQYGALDFSAQEISSFQSMLLTVFR